jgi:dTDP-D-glucose 4,6-dehydratase
MCISDNDIDIFGEGTQLRDYVFIDDVCDAMIQAVLDEHCIGGTYNVGSGSRTTFLEMAETVVKTVERARINFSPWLKK